MSGLVGALGLLTRFPLPRGAAGDPGAALPWYPVVGAFLGLLAAAVYAATSLILPATLAAALAIAFLVLATGALHEDGLADAADAWGGGTTREETLRILRDPGVGTYGALALGFSLIVRVVALATLAPAMAISALPAVHALSRTAMAGVLATTPSARDDGLGASVRRTTTPVAAAAAVLVAVAASAVLLGLAAIAAIVVAAFVAATLRLVAIHRIGGVTGDVLGATEQLIEIGLMLLLAGFASSPSGSP